MIDERIILQDAYKKFKEKQPLKYDMFNTPPNEKENLWKQLDQLENEGLISVKAYYYSRLVQLTEYGVRYVENYLI